MRIIHEDDSNSISALIHVHAIATSNLDAALAAFETGPRSVVQLTRIATMSAVVSDLAGQLKIAMLKAAGELSCGHSLNQH